MFLKNTSLYFRQFQTDNDHYWQCYWWFTSASFHDSINCDTINDIEVSYRIMILFSCFRSHSTSRSIGPRFAVKGEEGYLLVPLDSSHYSDDTPTSNRPSIIGTVPTEIHAIEGQEVVLRVRFHGDPMPKLSWKQDGEEIDWENCSFALRNGAIVFPYVEVSHSGEYEVTGSNDNGSESVSIVLTVYPETDLMAPLKEGVISSVRIPLEEFGQYVNNLRNNNNKLFREQFKVL